MAPRRAAIYPELDLATHPARREAAYARAEHKRGIIGNGFLNVRIQADGRHIETAIIENRLMGESYQVSFSPIAAVCSDGPLPAASFVFDSFEARGSSDTASLTIHSHCGWCKSAVSYVLARGEHVIRKSVLLHDFSRDVRFNEISLVRHEVDAGYTVRLHDAGMFSPVAFLRGRRGGLFFCAEFPGYFAELHDRMFRFYYQPSQDVRAGHSLRLLTACIGAYGLTGRPYTNPYHESGANLDEGEAQWFREYLMLGGGATCAPQIEIAAPGVDAAGPSDLEALDQCRWFGAERVYLPRLLRAPAAYPHRATMERRLEQEHVSATLALRDAPQSTHWLALSSTGLPATPDHGACLAFDEFRDFLIERYQSLLDLYRFRDIEVSGAPIVPCSNPSHEHYPGLDSLQRSFWGLIEVIATLRENVGHVGCSGPYASYGAGLARISDWMGALAEAHPLALPDIHPGRLFGDMTRLYFRRSHSFLLPVNKMATTVGLSPETCPQAPYPGADHYPWHAYHDSAGWRYSVLSAVATGRRHRVFAPPADLDEADRAFARYWFSWQAERLSGHRHVQTILDEPGLGCVDGYAYTDARSSTVFLFNGSYDEHEVELCPHLNRDSVYVFREVYPEEYVYLGPEQGLFRRDSVLHLRMKPREARVIEMVRRSPASAKRKRPEVFGCTYREEGNKVIVQGPAGGRCHVGLRLGNSFEVHEVRLPGTPFSPHLSEWVYAVRPYQEGVQHYAAGPFAGKSCSTEMAESRNVWLHAKVHPPEGLAPLIDQSPFELQRPVWTYPERLFFVIRMEPPAMFDPIRTASEELGVPEGYDGPRPIKCGIDLAQANYGWKAWINGEERPVYPALAAWRNYSPNPHPVTAYFFEAGSKLRLGHVNHIVLFANRFDAGAFKGVMIEHLPELIVERTLDVK